jgi:putative ABC transport system ATP-binding protein
MLRLNREHGLTFVWVTHALEVAQQASRFITMRDGLIERDSALAARQHAGISPQTENGGER